MYIQMQKNISVDTFAYISKCALSSSLIGRKTLLMLTVKMVSAMLGLVGMVFLTRYLGKDILGTVTYTMALVATFNCIADLGFNAAYVKRVTEGADRDDALSTFIVIKLALMGLMVLVIILGLFLATSIFQIGLVDVSFDLIVLFILYYIFYDLASIATTTFDSQMKTAKTQVTVLSDIIIRLPLIMMVALFSYGVIELAYTYVIGGLAVVIIALILLSREQFTLKKPTLYRSFLVFALPLTIYTIISAIWLNFNVILIGFFYTQVEVAYYGYSLSVVNILIMIGTSVGTLLFPAFSKLHTDGDIHQIRAMTWRSERYLSMIAMPAVILIVLFPFEVAKIVLGAQFEPSGAALQYLVIGAGFSVVNYGYYIQLNSVNRSDLVAKMTIWQFLLNVVLVLILVPESLFGVKMFGLSFVGAAIASLLVTITGALIVRIFVKDLTSTSSNVKTLLHVISAEITGIFLLLLSQVWTISHWYDLLFYAVFALIANVGILTVMKEFVKEDLEYFKEVINIREMKDYILEELRH